MSHGVHPRSLLTPAMRGVLDRMARAQRLPMHALSPQQARAFYESAAEVLDLPPKALPRVESLRIPVRDGSTIAATLFAAHSQKDMSNEGAVPERLPVLLYFHGGGFTVGSVNTHASLCRHLAHLAQAAVLSVDYRLAPEYRFPVAVHDAWDALVWLRAQADGLGLDAGRIAVGGDSAGGTLALVTALQARDCGLPLTLQMLFYPGCAADPDTASWQQFGQGFLLDRTGLDWFFGQYLNRPEEREDWRFAPLLAPDLEGVAPVWLGLAECDPLLDEGLQMADRLRMAGVTVDLELYHGVVHEFIKMGRAIPEALQAHQDAARALRQAWAR